VVGGREEELNEERERRQAFSFFKNISEERER